MRIKIELHLPSDMYKDVYLELPQENHSVIADSYFLYYLANEDKGEGEHFILIELLTNWLQAVKQLQDNDVCFLPFDFSDEYTGGFRVRREGECLELVYGWLYDIPGYSPNTVDFSEYTNAARSSLDVDFELSMSESEFTEAVKASIANL